MARRPSEAPENHNDAATPFLRTMSQKLAEFAANRRFFYLKP